MYAIRSYYVVAPVSAPYLFEEPFITTGLSGWYLYHEYPNSSIFDGGHLNAVALQARVAITDRLERVARSAALAERFSDDLGHRLPGRRPARRDTEPRR